MEQNNIMNTYKRYDVIFTKGKGSYIYDKDGAEYLDFVSGIATNSLGHCSNVISDTIKSQADKLMHISNYYYSDEAIELSKNICKDSPYKSVFFANSGSEAIEGAIKICKKHGQTISKDKNIIIYMNNSFHGRSIGALTITGRDIYKAPFSPLMPCTEYVEFNNTQDLENAMNENVCGVFIEPIQGEGGLNTAKAEFLQSARDLCDKYNSILVFDEIQCGAGRLGSYFCSDFFKVVPDVVAMAKGLGGGFPIGAIVASEKAKEILTFGDHGTTYGGNPLACSVANAVVSVTKNPDFLSEVSEKSKYLKEKLSVLKNRYTFITRIKGEGLLLGVEFNMSAKLIADKAFKNKLLLVTAGDNVVRILPPLNVSYKEIDLFINKFEGVLKSW